LARARSNERYKASGVVDIERARVGL
jgi:hypothetical protein